MTPTWGGQPRAQIPIVLYSVRGPYRVCGIIWSVLVYIEEGYYIVLGGYIEWRGGYIDWKVLYIEREVLYSLGV